jgi:hypothetical protein
VIDEPPPVFHVPSSAVSVLPIPTVPLMNGTDVFDGATTPARIWKVRMTSEAAA